MLNLKTGLGLAGRLEHRSVFDAAFSGDGRFCAVATDGQSVGIWEIPSLRQVAVLGGQLLGISSVAFSPDRARIATASGGKEAIKLWDANGKLALLTLEAPGSLFLASAFSPDGNVLGSQSQAGTLHVWRAPFWEEIEEVERRNRESD